MILRFWFYSYYKKPVILKAMEINYKSLQQSVESWSLLKYYKITCTAKSPTWVVILLKTPSNAHRNSALHISVAIIYLPQLLGYATGRTMAAVFLLNSCFLAVPLTATGEAIIREFFEFLVRWNFKERSTTQGI